VPYSYPPLKTPRCFSCERPIHILGSAWCDTECLGDTVITEPETTHFDLFKQLVLRGKISVESVVDRLGNLVGSDARRS
jgi:hypothetical protein